MSNPAYFSFDSAPTPLTSEGPVPNLLSICALSSFIELTGCQRAFLKTDAQNSHTLPFAYLENFDPITGQKRYLLIFATYAYMEKDRERAIEHLGAPAESVWIGYLKPYEFLKETMVPDNLTVAMAKVPFYVPRKSEKNYLPVSNAGVKLLIFS